MAHDTALSIISDAAAELGLGTVADAYGSTDANIIQLRGLLKSVGRDLVRDRDWTHLIKEFSFVTRPNWTKSTAYTQQATLWADGGEGFGYTAGDLVQDQDGSTTRLYICTQTGLSGNGPGAGGIGQAIADGTCTWKYLNDGQASIVVQGTKYYTCSHSGTSGSTATSGPLYDASLDGSVFWGGTSGNASDYALPSDFSNIIDQTGWNRTNRLPVGGPVDGQVWQYLAGRQQGVVFNVIFRPIQNVIRLYPYIDPPGGYNIVFEYISKSWVSATGGTVPTTDAPTANTDICYFDQLLLMRGLKLAWLKAKGFATANAQQEYDECWEETANADGSAPVLNLRGRGPYDPLLGIGNIPITNYGL